MALSRGAAAGSVGSAAPHPDVDTIRAITRTHPRYDQWREDWIGLGHVYEGDGPYLDGGALVPHARELIYAKSADGIVDFTTSIGQQRKFIQRKTLARYENFASVIVDALVDHQYVKTPARQIDQKGVLGHHPLQLFWDDVDGFGTDIDEWLEFAQTLAHVYGHVFVLMDRLENVERAAQGKTPRVRTLSSASRPVLRLYIPPDAPDWLAPTGNLTSIKFIEAVERRDLLQPALGGQSQSIIWTPTTWTRYANQGKRITSADHGFGRLPVIPFYARRRARIPVIGRSTLRDFRLYRDHYNMISELREIYRSQTFSMLNIQLAEGETVEIARARLGDHAGTDSLLFTSGAAEFIAPPVGPAEQYALAINTLERKIFQLVGIYSESRTRSTAAVDMRLETMGLSHMLAHFADQAETLDYKIAGLWFLAQYGPDRARTELDRSNLVISHPDEFYTEQLTEVVTDAAATIAIGVGPTATALIKRNVVNVALRDISQEQVDTIADEITERAQYDAEQAQLIADAAMRSGKPIEGALASGKGNDPNADPSVGGKSTDPRAAAARPGGGDTGVVAEGKSPSSTQPSPLQQRRAHKTMRRAL